jgi:hypothetical protein
MSIFPSQKILFFQGDPDNLSTESKLAPTCVKLDEPLTSNPNVRGFGHGDGEILLQDPLSV